MHTPDDEGKVISKYGLTWRNKTELEIERDAICLGGTWEFAGKLFGLGLYHHVKEFQTLLWPDKVWHRWNELLLQEFVRNKIVGVLGPASSGKTTEVGDYALTWYFCHPYETTVLVSSTDAAGLERRIWGHIKKRWREAKRRFRWIPGQIIESKQMILSDSLEELARDFRNAMIGVPCVSNGTFVGLGKYVGVKNKHLILCADEAQFMPKTFVDAISNLNKNPGFKCFAMGNPKDPTDALGVITEPSVEEGGWDGMDREEKTRCWNTRFASGRAINLVGTDSPNFDNPLDEQPRYPFLITPRQIKEDMAFYGRDSLQFSMMNLGVMPIGGVARRVLTRMMVEKFNAKEPVVWGTETPQKVAGLDASYSSVGGDRTVIIEGWWGPEKSGRTVLSQIGQAEILVVSAKKNELQQDQIAEQAKAWCEARKIPPENFYYDGTGRSSLTSAIGRIWSPHVNAIEFGGKPTTRPVAHGGKKEDGTEKRVMTCAEHFVKFVTELWFSARYVVEANQARGMTDEVMEEGCMREWGIVKDNRIEVEDKQLTKIRMGRSPDIFDAWVCVVEGARRQGFKIERFENAASVRSSNEWLKDLARKQREFRAKHNLVRT